MVTKILVYLERSQPLQKHRGCQGGAMRRMGLLLLLPLQCMPRKRGLSLVATLLKISHAGCYCARWHGVVCYGAPEWFRAVPRCLALHRKGIRSRPWPCCTARSGSIPPFLLDLVSCHV